MQLKGSNTAVRSCSIEEWKPLVVPLIEAGATTPFYLFSADPMAEALRHIEQAFESLPITHWLSAKTQPLPDLFRWWKAQGRPIEVVSELEFLAAQACGFAPEQILVNGPAKHRWLPKYPVAHLNVNFDSIREIEALGHLAQKLQWRLGVRVNTDEEFDPEKPEYPTQFGLGREELLAAASHIQRLGLGIAILHLHLRTNITKAESYATAAEQAIAMASAAGLHPTILDLGGGFPPPRVRSKGGENVDGQFSLRSMAEVYRNLLKRFPQFRELWLENGRWWSARSGVLVVKVLDSKTRRGKRNLICDGGRTMNALVSMWENHDHFAVPERTGEEIVTTVNGPTCMAFDKLIRRRLPVSLEVGDHLVWLDAGAYHLPWETRFSHGLAAVYWHENEVTRLVRSAETFPQWWNQWSPATASPLPLPEATT